MEEYSRQRGKNPQQNVNFFSNIFFLWTGKVFARGMKKHPMTSDELSRPMPTDLSQVLGDLLEANWNKELKDAKLKERKPNLLNAVIKTFWWEYGVKLGLLHAVNELVFKLCQPLLLGVLLSYFREDSKISLNYALTVAGTMVIVLFLSSLFTNHYFFGGLIIGMRVRVACCSLIYRKALRLSKTALGETAPGKVVNLLSNDVSRFDLVCTHFHFMWSAPVGALFIIYFVWSQAGVSGIIGILSVFLFIPLQSYFGRLASKYRLQIAYRTDERVRLIDEIITGINVIKMYAWEKSFAKLISTARNKELKIVKKSSYLRGVYMTVIIFNTRFAMFATMMCLSLLGEALSAEKIFVYATYFSMISFTMSGMFIRGIAEISEALVSMKRLTDYLTQDEFVDHILSLKKEENKEVTDKGSVEVKNVTAQWSSDSLQPTLQNVTVRVSPFTLNAVVGPVGGGKSSFLQILLGELPLSSGEVRVNGRISYACQEPWLFAATARQNITFGQPFDQTRYNEVVRVCALKSDFKQWPHGDMTIVGERGTSLSGGQRARINLARAVYKDADIYLLDDPLSAVDTHVGKHLFDECINGFLADKTRILVTHQLQYLESAKNIVLIDNGAVVLQGTFSELVQSHSEFAHLLLQGNAEENDDRDTNKLEDPFLRRISAASSGSSSGSQTLVRKEVAMMPAEEVKEASGSTLFKYFSSGINVVVMFILACFFILTQLMASLCDYWVSIWTYQDATLRLWQNKLNETVFNSTNFGLSANATFNDLSEVGHVDNAAVLLSTESCRYIYIALIITLFTFAISRSFAFYKVCMLCSQKLHDNMFSSVSQTFLSFFHNNPSGRILNRFSKDLGSIDEVLSKVLLDAGQMMFTVVGGIAITIVVNYYFLLPVLIVLLFGVIARSIYTRSSINIKRIEAMTRSPVFTHLNATLQGLTTIRAYHAEEILRKEFDNHQDLHTAALHLFISTGSGFAFWLDMLCFLLITCVTFVLLLTETVLYGGQVGLAITQTMGLSYIVQYGMKQSAEVSNQLTSVERVLEYTNLEREANLEETPFEKDNKKLIENWPSFGEIKFTNLCLYYKKGDPAAIRDLTLVIQSGEKVGIVGRTGAGKSSLIAALFRLAKTEGKIAIDGIETDQVSLRRLRSKISIIPQEPVLFSGTIRRNLDPFQVYRDADIWQALEEVELKDALAHGLQTGVLEGGSNFSVGQKQLLCLARAILRNNKILILDEATASVDPQTDALIQKTIRRKFQDCTVCTIAHRLNTIMDSDKILVMDFGQMVEFDAPFNLLQNRNGVLSQMVHQTGTAMAEQLRKIAEDGRKA